MARPNEIEGLRSGAWGPCGTFNTRLGLLEENDTLILRGASRGKEVPLAGLGSRKYPKGVRSLQVAKLQRDGGSGNPQTIPRLIGPNG